MLPFRATGPARQARVSLASAHLQFEIVFFCGSVLRETNMISRVSALIFAGVLLCAGARATPPVQATLALGNTTQGIAVDPAIAKAFVTNQDSATVSVININTLTVEATI